MNIWLLALLKSAIIILALVPNCQPIPLAGRARRTSSDSSHDSEFFSALIQLPLQPAEVSHPFHKRAHRLDKVSKSTRSYPHSSALTSLASPSKSGTILASPSKSEPSALIQTTALIQYSSNVTCKDNCSSNGYCLGASCVCLEGYASPTCAVPECPNHCNSHGECVNGQCFCHSGWVGSDCSYRGCLDNCNHHGYCHIGPDNSDCVCFPGFSGVTCLIGPVCGFNENGQFCSGRGQCVNNKCLCQDGYTGDDCSQIICPKLCSGFGVCNGDTGTCECEYPHYGQACEHAYCPSNCTGHGTCDELGKCQCDDGFFGEDCAPANCPDDCSGNGKCDIQAQGERRIARGVCICDENWSGDACDQHTCAPGRAGKNCEERVCLDDCNGPEHGVCDTSSFTCACINGWAGTSCQFRSCPHDCNHHGRCNNGTCVCVDDWYGDTCENPPIPCLNDCSGRGVCRKGVCYCNDGYSGEDCYKYNLAVSGPEPEAHFGIVCIPRCSVNGECVTVNGTNECFCKNGWSGLACDTYVGHNRSIDNGTLYAPAFFEQRGEDRPKAAIRDNDSTRKGHTTTSSPVNPGLRGNQDTSANVKELDVIPSTLEGDS